MARRPLARRSFRLLLALLATPTLLTASGCTGDEIQAPEPPEEGEFTVDASVGWAYASLDEGTVVTVADPSTSTAWDIGFNATSVALNGGTAGPGNVTGYCHCQNAGATNEQILAMTPASEQPDFDAVTAAMVPPASSFNADVFATHKWYKYNLAGDHRISPTFDVYLIRRGDEVYKVQLINYYNASGDPRHITVRYARLVP